MLQTTFLFGKVSNLKTRFLPHYPNNLPIPKLIPAKIHINKSTSPTAFRKSNLILLKVSFFVS